MLKNGKEIMDILTMLGDNKNRFSKTWLMGYLLAARAYGGISDNAYDELLIDIMNLNIKE